MDNDELSDDDVLRMAKAAAAAAAGFRNLAAGFARVSLEIKDAHFEAVKDEPCGLAQHAVDELLARSGRAP